MEAKKKNPDIFQEYEVDSNNEIYTLTIGIFSNDTDIYFSIKPKNNSLLLFEGNYTLNDLYTINEIFREFSSISQLIYFLNDMANHKRVFIEKNENDNLSLKLGIIIIDYKQNESKVFIDLKSNELDKSDEKAENKEVLDRIIELENQCLQKDEEIKILNQKLEKLENKTQIEIKSDIVTKDDIDFIQESLNPKKKLILELIYNCVEYPDTPQAFHSRCDGIRNVIVFIETTEGVRFGGYTSVGFNLYSGPTLDNNAFIFSVDKKNIYRVKMNKDAIFCRSGYGPCFCGTNYLNISIDSNHFLTCQGNTSKANNNTYEINTDYEINNSKEYFHIKKLEVFKLNNY